MASNQVGGKLIKSDVKGAFEQESAKGFLNEATGMMSDELSKEKKENMTIKIFDNDRGFLTFDLREILDTILHGNIYEWEIQYCTINILSLASVHNNDLEEVTPEKYQLIELLNSSTFNSVNWDTLKKISKLQVQFIDCKIIGKLDKTEIIEICAIDSSYWTVKTEIDEIMEGLKKKFQDYIILN